MSNKYDYQIKIIIVGNSGSGKTALCRQLDERKFIQNTDTTIGIDFISKIFRVESKLLYKAHIWDTAGQESYKSLITSYFRKCSGTILLFDLNDKDGLDNIQEWYDMIKQYAPEDSPILLVGNKCDLKQNVGEDKIKKFAEVYNLDYLVTSATTYKNTYNCFFYLVNKIHQQFIDENNVNVITRPQVFNIHKNSIKSNSCC